MSVLFVKADENVYGISPGIVDLEQCREKLISKLSVKCPRSAVTREGLLWHKSLTQ